MSSGGSYSGIAAGGASQGISEVAKQVPTAVQAIVEKHRAGLKNLLDTQAVDQQEYNAVASQDITGLDENQLAARQQKLADLTNRMTGRRTTFDAQAKNPFAKQLTEGMDSATLFSPKYTLEQDTSRLSQLRNQYTAATTGLKDLEQQLQTALSDPTHHTPQEIVTLKARVAELDAAGGTYANKLALPWVNHSQIYADVDPISLRSAGQQIGYSNLLTSAMTSLTSTPDGAALYAELAEKQKLGTLDTADMGKISAFASNDTLAGQVKELYTAGKHDQARSLLGILKNKLAGIAGFDAAKFMQNNQLNDIDKVYADPTSKQSVIANEIEASTGLANDVSRQNISASRTGQQVSQFNMKYQSYQAVADAAEKGDVEGLQIFGQAAVDGGFLKPADLLRFTGRAEQQRLHTDFVQQNDDEVRALDKGGRIEEAISKGSLHLVSQAEKAQLIHDYGQTVVDDMFRRSALNMGDQQDADTASRNFTIYQSQSAQLSLQLQKAKTPLDIEALPLLARGQAMSVMADAIMRGGDPKDPAFVAFADKNGINMEGFANLANIDVETKTLAMDTAKWGLFDQYMQRPELAENNPAALTAWAEKLGLDPQGVLDYVTDLADETEEKRKSDIATYRAQPELIRLEIAGKTANIIATRVGVQATRQGMVATELGMTRTREQIKADLAEQARQAALFPGQLAQQTATLNNTTTNTAATAQGMILAQHQDERAAVANDIAVRQDERDAQLQAGRVTAQGDAHTAAVDNHGQVPYQNRAYDDQHLQAGATYNSTITGTEGERQRISQSGQLFPSTLTTSQANAKLAQLNLLYKPLEYKLNVAQLKASIGNQDKAVLAQVLTGLSGQRQTIGAQLDGANQAVDSLTSKVAGFNQAAIKPYKLDKNGKPVMIERGQPTTGAVGYMVDPKMIDPMNDANYGIYQQVAQGRGMIDKLQHDYNQVGKDQADTTNTLKTLLTGAGTWGQTTYDELSLDGPKYRTGWTEYNPNQVGPSRQGVTRVAAETGHPGVTAMADAIYNAEGRTAAINKQGQSQPYGLVTECVGCSEAQARPIIVSKIMRWATQYEQGKGFSNPSHLKAFDAMGNPTPSFVAAFGLKYSPPAAAKDNQFWISNTGGWLKAYGHLAGEAGATDTNNGPATPSTGTSTGSGNAGGSATPKPAQPKPQGAVSDSAALFPTRQDIVTKAPPEQAVRGTGISSATPFYTSAGSGQVWLMSSLYFNNTVKNMVDTMRSTATKPITPADMSQLIIAHLKSEGFGGSLLNQGTVLNLVTKFNAAAKLKK